MRSVCNWEGKNCNFTTDFTKHSLFKQTSAGPIIKYDYNRLLILKRKTILKKKRKEKSADTDTDTDYTVVNNDIRVYCARMK